MQRIWCILCLGFFLCAALLTARLAYAEALFRRGARPPSQSLRYNPRQSSAWIALGLEAERHGRKIEAEHDLLEAARWDRQYLPSWTLANFYFRRQDPESFWLWARRAAALAYDDLRPLLQLANALEPDALATLHELGGSDRLARADLDYLTVAGRLDAAQQVARLLLSHKSPEDQPRLIEMTDRQIRAGNGAYALELWTGLFPRPDSKQLLTNGNFDQSPRATGFDWRMPSAEGIRSNWGPGRLTVSFSGSQAESCPLLEQIVPLAGPFSRYRLSFEYLTSGLPSPTGVQWDLDGQQSPALEPSLQWRAESAVFLHHLGASNDVGLSHLRLLYRRNLGTVRAEGQAEFRNVRMEPIT